MEKPLSEMTLEELWELFPIFLMKHQDCWGDWFYDEKKNLSELLKINDIRINHIGSTAIHSIWAKPIIDILVEIPSAVSMEAVKNTLINNDYLCMSEDNYRKSFNKGYTNKGFAERVFHLHLRYCGDNDEIYFRDYLNDNPDVAKEYQELKLSLWKKYEHDRDSYTNAKTEFVKKYTSIAKEIYGSSL